MMSSRECVGARTSDQAEETGMRYRRRARSSPVEVLSTIDL